MFVFHRRAVSVALGSMLSRSAGRQLCYVGNVIALAGRACRGQPTATKRAILVPEISGAGEKYPRSFLSVHLHKSLGSLPFQPCSPILQMRKQRTGEAVFLSTLTK